MGPATVARVAAVLQLAIALVLATFGFLAFTLGKALDAPPRDAEVAVFGAFLLVLVAGAVGVWRGRPWAWYASLVGVALLLVAIAVQTVRVGDGDAVEFVRMNAIVLLGVAAAPLAVAALLATPGARDHCEVG